MAAPRRSTLCDLEFASFLVDHQVDDDKLDAWLGMV